MKMLSPAPFIERGEAMIVFTIICLVIITALLIVCYAIMAIAEDADARADAMYEKWKREKRRKI